MKFLRSAHAALVFLLPALITAGCIFSPTSGGTTPPPQYKPPTSPENVINNIQALYIRLDRVEYDSTLAQDYVFRFQPSDIQQGQPDSLIRVEEMTFAEHLFVDGAPGAQRASRIQLVITIQSSSDDNRIGHVGWKKYIVNTALNISFADGQSLSVNSPAWFYFRQEPAGSPRWVLAEWADQPGSTGAPIHVALR